jgi:NNP family nitrate/nitrite transporter-like MFS transporter
MGIINAAVFKLVPKEIPESIGGAVGWVGGFGAFGGFIIPLLIALPIQFNGDNPTSYAIGFSIFAVLALSSLFTMLWQFYRERFKSVGVIAFALLRRPY